MIKRALLSGFLITSATGALAQTADTVVAVVNGTEITLGEMIVAKSRLPEQYQSIPNEQLFSGILEQMVQQQLFADELEEDTKRVRMAVSQEMRSIRAGEVIDRITLAAVTPEAIEAVYQDRIAGIEPVTEWNANHILVETEEEAASLVTELEAGADFEELAKAKSTGPSGPNGGALGWFGPGMMVEPFEAAVMGLEAGGISGPVQTQFGWHVLKLNEVRTQPIPSLEDMRPDIESELAQEAFLAAAEALKEGAEVDTSGAVGIDPAVLSNLSLLTDE